MIQGIVSGFGGAVGCMPKRALWYPSAVGVERDCLQWALWLVATSWLQRALRQFACNRDCSGGAPLKFFWTFGMGA